MFTSLQTENPIFPPWNQMSKQKEVSEMIGLDINMFFMALNSRMFIRDLNPRFKRNVIDAQANISKNIVLVRQIVSEDTTQEDLTAFFETVSIFEFPGEISTSDDFRHLMALDNILAMEYCTPQFSSVHWSTGMSPCTTSFAVSIQMTTAEFRLLKMLIFGPLVHTI